MLSIENATHKECLNENESTKRACIFALRDIISSQSYELREKVWLVIFLTWSAIKPAKAI